MKTIKALIVDDEPKLRKVLHIKLEQHCPNLQVIGEAENITTAYPLIQNLHPDLVFLDIAMPGGSGLELLEQFDSFPFEIIFVTGFNDYMLDALRVSAIDYLLKPVSNSELVAAVNRAQERILDREKIKRYENLKHNVQHLGDQQTRISIPGMNAYDFVKIADIIRCEGWQKYTKIHLSNGSCLISSYNIGVFREMLSSYSFFNCHKSHLINTTHISRYLRDGSVIMSDNATVPVSRRKRDEFMQFLVSK
ncbi:MAG: LytTR family DNA-binding domain-containing protein [Saprospiraceae bacterium]